MNNLSGGYIMIDLNASKNLIKQQIEKALTIKKPCLVYDNDYVAFMTISKENVTLLQSADRFYYITENIEITKHERITNIQLNEDYFNLEYYQYVAYIESLPNGSNRIVLLIYDYEDGSKTIPSDSTIATFTKENFSIISSNLLVEVLDDVGDASSTFKIKIEDGDANNSYLIKNDGVISYDDEFTIKLDSLI